MPGNASNPASKQRRPERLGGMPFVSPDEERTAHLVKDAARAFIRGMQIRLAGHGVTYGHWTILRVLWQCDGLSQRILSDMAGVTEPTTFTAVKSLESLGYVARLHLPGDNKKMHVFLTKKGKGLMKRLVPLAEEVNTVAVAGLPEGDVDVARRVLIAMASNLMADEERALSEGSRMPSTQEIGRMMTGGG